MQRPLFKAFGLQPVPLSVIDVMTALQTNMVEGVYTSPLAAVALQWFTKVNYMTDTPLANAAGAVLISARQFNKISPDHQTILQDLGEKYLSKLNALSREDNVTAKETLLKNNVEIVPPASPDVLAAYYEIGVKARRALIDQYYSDALLQEVESTLKSFRADAQAQE